MRRLVALLLACALSFGQAQAASSIRPIAGTGGAASAQLPTIQQALVDLNMAAGQFYQDGIGSGTNPASYVTVTRALSKYCQNSFSQWITVAANLPCVTDLGYLSEKADTEQIRNNSFQGAVVNGALPTNASVVTAAGLTTTVSALSTQNGAIDCIDLHITGTTTGTAYQFVFDTLTNATAAPGDIWIAGFFLSMVNGNLSNISAQKLWVNWNGAGPAYTSMVPGNALTFVSSAALTAPSLTTAADLGFELDFSSGVFVDVTLRFGMPALRKKAMMSSPIRTTGASVTRPADIGRLTTMPTTGGQVTAYADFIGLPGTNDSSGHVIFDIGDGGNNNRINVQTFASSGNLQTNVNVAGSNIFANNTSATLAGVEHKFAIGFQSGTQYSTFDGTAVATGTGTGVFSPTAVTIGQWQNSNQCDCYIKRLTIMPAALQSAFTLVGWTQNGITPAVLSPPTIQAAIDLDFVNGRYVSGGVVYGDPAAVLNTVRNSDKYCDDLSGVWKKVTPNVLCATNKGAWVETGRTNLIRDNSMQGAVPGVPGTLPTNGWGFGGAGLNQQVVGVGTINGIDYIDIRFFGTSTSQFPAVNFDGFSVGIGQTHTISIFFQVVDNTNISNIQSVFLKGFDGVANSIVGPNLFPGTSLTRVPASGTMVGTFLQPALTFTLNHASGDAVDVTFRIGWPQDEDNLINSSVASASIVTGVSGCPSGGGIGFNVQGGTGTGAQVFGTVTAGVLTAITSIGGTNSYSVFPTSPATITDGCTVSPTVNLVPTNNSARGFMTSPIRTTNATLNRPADNVTLKNVPIFGTCHTETAEMMWPISPTTNEFWRVLSLDDNTGNNREELYTGNNALLASMSVYLGGVSQWDNSINATQIVLNTVDKTGQSLGVANFASAHNGVLGRTQTSGTPLSSQITRIGIGSFFGGGVQGSAYHRRVTIWPTACATTSSLAAATQ